MARGLIGTTVEAGNAVYTTVYTMPADSSGLLANITVYNTTAGGLTITLAIRRQDGKDHVILNAATSGANATTYYGKGSSTALCPIALQPGEYLQAKGSGAGIEVMVSGLKIS